MSSDESRWFERLGRPWAWGCMMALCACFFDVAMADEHASHADKPAATKQGRGQHHKAKGAAPAVTPTPSPSPAPVKRSPYFRRGSADSALDAFPAFAGIDKLKVKLTASGNLVRFSYVVTDPEKAKALADRGLEPMMIDTVDQVALKVPVMEKVGPLRQSTTPVLGREYWMVFSNKGGLVKVGDVVDIVIGAFHANGLRVE